MPPREGPSRMAPRSVETMCMSSPGNALRDYWYPVATAGELGEKPLARKLLDTPLVLWRSADGIRAFRDVCIHRGARLSLGWVEGSELTCPYHGWCFDRDGKVVRIPSLPPERPIPAKAAVDSYRCKERYGLIFVCLGTPRAEIYDVPEFSDKDFMLHLVGPITWMANAARSLENFMDEAHLPWVHNGTLGNRNEVPPIPNREISERADGFYYETRSEVRSRLDPTKMTENRLTYDIQLPFTVYHENIYPGNQRVIDLFFVTPVSEHESVRWMLVARNFGLDQPTQKFIDFTLGVWEEDKAIVESQRPEHLPLDWDDELHVRGPDGPSVVYRKLFKSLAG